MAFDNQLAARAKDKNSRKNDYHRWLSNRRNRFIEAGGFKIKHRIRKKFLWSFVAANKHLRNACEKSEANKKMFCGSEKAKIAAVFIRNILHFHALSRLLSR